MDADGRRAHKVIYVLLLVALTAAFAWTLKRGDEPAPEQRIEQQVAARARPRIEDAIRTARSRGDTEMADWLENMLRGRDARVNSDTRCAASAPALRVVNPTTVGESKHPLAGRGGGRGCLANR